MRPKSMPYWKGDMDTSVHASKHFQFSFNPPPVDASSFIVALLLLRVTMGMLQQDKDERTQVLPTLYAVNVVSQQRLRSPLNELASRSM
jgi:hypothetical protein